MFGETKDGVRPGSRLDFMVDSFLRQNGHMLEEVLKEESVKVREKEVSFLHSGKNSGEKKISFKKELKSEEDPGEEEPMSFMG